MVPVWSWRVGTRIRERERHVCVMSCRGRGRSLVRRGPLKTRYNSFTLTFNLYLKVYNNVRTMGERNSSFHRPPIFVLIVHFLLPSPSHHEHILTSPYRPMNAARLGPSGSAPVTRICVTPRDSVRCGLKTHT